MNYDESRLGSQRNAEPFWRECVFAKEQPREVIDFLSEVEGDPRKADSSARPTNDALSEFRIFLQEIQRFPDVGIGLHYSHLRWTTEKGNRVRRSLEEELGYIDYREEPSGFGRPRMVYFLTEKGLAFMKGTA